MKSFYILFFALSLALSCCGLKSDADGEHRRDTVINLGDRIEYWSGILLYGVPVVEMLDKDLYAQTGTGNYYNVFIYDTFRDTVVDLFNYNFEKHIDLRLNDLSKCYTIQSTEFVEDFINTYYNHYPLTDKGYKNIRKIIVYSLLQSVPWNHSDSYRNARKDILQPSYIVDSCFVNDTLNKIYKVSICDTIDNQTAKVELRYQNNHYKFFYEMYYKGRRY
ncbi:MAG: hypothetical protein IKQ70_04125 [Bacteroidales bacterium]|nr:hypothetical protein [Bacteroidales bacterium]